MLNTILTKMKSFAKDETGASAIEYAVIAAVIVVAVVAALTLLDVGGLFGDITAALPA